MAAVLAGEAGVTDIQLLQAALLHDTVEDTDTSLQEVQGVFGEAVAYLVSEVTDDKSQPKERRKELQIEHAPHKSERAKQLKLADKICNIRDIDSGSPASWSSARKVEYLDWASKVVAGCRGTHAVLEQLFDEAIAQARQRLQPFE